MQSHRLASQMGIFLWNFSAFWRRRSRSLLFISRCSKKNKHSEEQGAANFYKGQKYTGIKWLWVKVDWKSIWRDLFHLLRFNTGSGTCIVVSKVQVTQGRWHQLVVTRNRRNAMLSVDNEPHIEGEAPRGTDGLNLDTDLFIGGVPVEMKQE